MMTWQELADFINNEMPECNRNQTANVWDASCGEPTGGNWYEVKDISPYDADEQPNEHNFYSIDINTELGTYN